MPPPRSGTSPMKRNSVFVEDSFACPAPAPADLERRRAGAGRAGRRGRAGPEEVKVEDLASRAVRLGRTGKAVAVALDYADDAGAAQRLVVDSLVRPIDRPTS